MKELGVAIVAFVRFGSVEMERALRDPRAIFVDTHDRAEGTESSVR
jgi:hypothetical protein